MAIDDKDTGAVPADSLRADLEAAFDADQGADLTPAPVEAPEQQPATTGDRPRDESGRFLPKDALPPPSPVQKAADAAVRSATQSVQQTQQAQQPQQVPGQAPPGAPLGPPPGWSVQSKAVFDKLPDPVKADIAKREAEVSQGFAKLAEYKPLDPYVSMAQNQGTTLPEALERYVAAENLLEQEPINGILWLCQRYNVHPALLLQAIQGPAGGPQPPQASPLDPVFGQLQAVNGRLAQIEAEREQFLDHQVLSQIEQFKADPANIYFENVRHDMGRRIKFADLNGEDLSLRDAYNDACWAHPEIRPLLINQQVEAARQDATRRTQSERSAARSLPPGSPVAGGTLARDEPASTLRDEIVRSFNDYRV
jgi:hypothetical protein